jgi:SAM-dependent methyltransferase
LTKRKQTTDRHALYLASVQDPMSDIERVSKIYHENFGKRALSFREDFSGTFALSCCWVQSDEDRSAIAIDIDHETIEYGKKNYYANLSKSEQERLEVIEGNAIVETDKVDVVATFNFSYCLLHKRAELLEYLKKVHQSLNREGMLILDIFGGSESEIPEVQERDIDNCDYISPFLFEFERKDFNPITRLANYGIHFKYPDGTELLDAFKYHFRMWSITELRDLLEEAGFSKSLVYWEDFDDEGYGNGAFYKTEKEENTYNWNAYIVGLA